MTVCAIGKNICFQTTNVTDTARLLWLGAREVIHLRKTCSSEKIHTLLQTRIWKLENQTASRELGKRIKVIKFQLFVNAFLGIFFSKVCDVSTLTAAIKNRAMASLTEPTLDEGRKKLLEEIQTYPEALGLDIVRGFDSVLVGSRQLTQSLMKRNAQSAYDLYDGAIRSLVHQANPLLDISEGTMDELIYLLVQNFLTPPSTVLGSDPNIPACEWPPVSASTVRTVSYTMENSTTLLYKTVMTREHYNLKYETKTHKITSIGVECRYNLETKEVGFTFFYTLDGNSLSWQRKDPFNLPCAGSSESTDSDC